MTDSDKIQQLTDQLTQERQTRIRSELQRTLERRGLPAEGAELRALKHSDRVEFTAAGEAKYGEAIGDAAIEALADELAAGAFDPVAAGKALAKSQRRDDNLSLR